MLVDLGPFHRKLRIWILIVLVRLKHHLIESVDSRAVKFQSRWRVAALDQGQRASSELDLGKFEDNQQVAKHGQTLPAIVDRVQDELNAAVVIALTAVTTIMCESYQPADYDRNRRCKLKYCADNDWELRAEAWERVFVVEGHFAGAVLDEKEHGEGAKAEDDRENAQREQNELLGEVDVFVAEHGLDLVLA